MLPIHKVLLIAFNAMLFHRFLSARVPRFDFFFAFFIENSGDFAEVSVNLSSLLSLFKSYKITLVVVEYPREDRVLAEIVEATAAKLVQL